MENGICSTSPPATPNSFSRPRPRPPRSPAETAKIQIQNRRREYLERNTGYFSSAEHEFADPDLYDSLIRRFQTPAEREAEGRARGWGKTLESSLMRGEARLERIASSYTGDRVSASASPSSTGKSNGDSSSSSSKTKNFTIDADLAEGKPATKAEGRAAWEEFLRERFVRGGDEDFDYSRVDGDDGLDSMENRDREEAYFDGEEPEWADDSEGDEDEDKDDEATEVGADRSGGISRRKRERILLGQTGIQDY